MRHIIFSKSLGIIDTEGKIIIIIIIMMASLSSHGKEVGHWSGT